MDKSAIENSSDATLEEMGLTKMGDKLSLRGFCKQSSDNETTDHKRGLLEAFLNVKRKKSSSKTPVKDVTCAVNPKEDKKKTNKIQLGWLHFDEKKQKFISVRLMKGGGTRDVDIPVTATRDDILKTCIELFFPDGFSEFAGAASGLEFRLANFKNEKIENTLCIGEVEVPFTLVNYIRAYQTNKVRLYLTSSYKVNDQLLEKDHNVDICGQISMLISEEEQSQDQQNMELAYDPKQLSCLMGSTSQRQQILQQQNLAFEDSLRIDKAKNDALEKEMSDLRRKELLRHERSLRVPTEPNEEDDAHIVVKVRHLTLGLLRRRFSANDLMQSVFNWIGAQSPEPEHFALCLPYGPPLLPNDLITKADRQTLSMDETILYDPDMADIATPVTQCSLTNVQEATDDNQTRTTPSPIILDFDTEQMLVEPMIRSVISETEMDVDGNLTR